MHKTCITIFLLLIFGFPALANTSPSITDISVLVGTFDAEEFVAANEDRFSLSTDSGDSLALVVNHYQRNDGSDRIMYEFYYSQASIDLRQIEIGSALEARYEADVLMYHAGGIFEFSGQNPSLIPFFGGSLGVTQIKPEGFSSESDFSLAVTGGFKWMPAKNVGIRIDGRLFATFVDTQTEIICSIGCVARFESDIWWQYQLAAGVVVRF